MEFKLTTQSIKCLTSKETYLDYINDIENYARICFQSEGHTGNSFVKKILINQHESVLEHFNLSFKIITDRAIANALVRHRHTAYTQESTHYIDYIRKNKPIEFIAPINMDPEGYYYIKESLNTYEQVYSRYGKNIARSFLPLGLKTELRMTTNIREWRHIIKLRGAFDHPQMLELIRLLYDWFKIELPLLIEDINIK